MSDTDATSLVTDWLEFLNFDGRLTGETAKTVKAVAEATGLTPHELLTKLLAEALADKLSPHAVRDQDVKVEPMTINAGNGGFHVLTFVTDGYGDLLTEDAHGQELAREKWDPTEEGGTNDIFRRLADESMQRTTG